MVEKLIPYLPLSTDKISSNLFTDMALNILKSSGLGKLMILCPLKDWQKLFNCEVLAERINVDFPVVTKEHRYLGSLYLALGRFLEAFGIFSHDNVLDKKALELIQVHRSIKEDVYLKRANALIQIDRQFFIKVLAGRIHDSIQGVSPKVLEKFVEDKTFLLEYFKVLGDSYEFDEENIIFKTNLFCIHEPDEVLVKFFRKSFRNLSLS